MIRLPPIAAAVFAAFIAPGALKAWRTGNVVFGACCAVVALRIGSTLFTGSLAVHGVLVPAIAELIWLMLLLRIALTSAERYPLPLAAAGLIGVLAHGLDLLGWIAHPPAFAAVIGGSIGLQVLWLAGVGIGLPRQPVQPPRGHCNDCPSGSPLLDSPQS